jgi:hypothetical protein
MSSWTPSIVPGGDDQNVYLVVSDFGRLGLAWCETDVEATDLETTSAICSTANIPTRCASSVSM